MPIHAQTQWQPIDTETEKTESPAPWVSIPSEGTAKNESVWEQLKPEEEKLKPEQLIWKEQSRSGKSVENSGVVPVLDERNQNKKRHHQATQNGFRWPTAS